MCKEKLITAYEVPENVEGDPYLRTPCTTDKAVSTMRKDRETGEYITLWEEKFRYPYKTKVATKLEVKTSEREITFVLKLEDGAWVWNGQNLWVGFWSILGISKDSPYGWIPSKWHDNLLYYKRDFLAQIREIDPYYKVSEFRRLTSLIFRQLLMNNGVSKFKAYVMAWFVDMWQTVSPNWWGVK